MNYLIIGNSAGGRSAAREIVRSDPSAEVTIISEEKHSAYYRPLISHLLARDVTEERVFMEPLSPADQGRVNIRLGVKAEAIDGKTKTVSFDNREKVAYDRLLLAAGGKPILPRIEGLQSEGVYQFNTLADVKGIIDFSGNIDRAVLVGAGLIGIRAACGLKAIGKEVTIVELLERPLPSILDSQGAQIVRHHLESQGIDIITGTSVKEVLTSNGAVSGVLTTDGRRHTCQAVIISIGVLPNLDLVGESGLRANRGILVDRTLQTNVADIYAAGDVCETYDPTLGDYTVNANWTSAVEEGALVGRNMAGASELYRGSLATNSLDLLGLPCITMGITNPGNDRFEVISKVRSESKLYRKLIFKGDLIVGAIFIGEVRGAGAVSNLIRDRVPLGGLKDSILEERRPYVHFLRSLYRDDFEGDISWRQELWSTEKYKKKFDDERWRQRERIKE